MSNRQVTIKDLARRLNLSTSTISRALRGLPDVNPTTMKKVKKLAMELNYEPNSVALSLVNKRTNTVGIVIPGFIIHFYSMAISAMQKHLMEEGFNVMICQSGEDYHTEVKNINTLLASRVDGIICSLSRETQDIGHLKHVQQKGIPLIMFNRVSKDLNVSKVLVDDYGGAREAVEHLVQNGYQRIAHIAGPKSLQITANRLSGYMDVLRKYEMPIHDELIVHCDFTIESGMKATEQLLCLPHPPDAIFVVCDAAAFGSYKVIKQKGLHIPDEIGVVGFTNEPLADLIEPGLTTISQPTYEIGQMAARLFLEQLKMEPEDRFPETRVLESELIIRGSSCKNVLSDHKQYN